MPSKTKLVPIGQALRKARVAAGLSQSDVARLTGMSVGQISQIEAGVRKSPAFVTVLRVARALHISLDSLVGEGGASASLFPQSDRERVALRRKTVELQREVRRLSHGLEEILRRLDGEEVRHDEKR